MINNLQAGLLMQEQRTARDHWLDQLTGFVLVDMGIISSPSMTQQGLRCRVKPFRLNAGQQVVYEGVEVLLPGNGIGGIDINLEGASCIVFGPYSSAVSVGSNGILGSNKPYDMKYLKCMPVGNPSMWVGKLEFDGIGNCVYKTSDSSFQFGSDGSLSYFQNVPHQQVVCDASGVLTWQTPQVFYEMHPDGTYYRYCKGVEPGSFTFFESFLDNVKDVFETTIEAFEEVDSEETTWQQLLAHNSWRKHTQYDYSTGNQTIKVYDADGNLTSTEETNSDGRRLLEVTDADGVNIFTRLVDIDGSLLIEIGDGGYSLEISADGAVTETQNGDKSITTTGNFVVAADGDVSIESTAQGMITLGNAVNTLGAFLDTIYTNLTSIHTEGSPASHTGSAWAATWIPAEQAKLAQVFS